MPKVTKQRDPNGQYCRYSFIIRNIDDEYGEPREPKESDVDGIRKQLRDARVNKYTFQIERGPETGLIHINGRVSFKHSVRASEAAKRFTLRISFRLEGPDEEASTFYCQKPDDRVAGPWTDKDGGNLYFAPCYNKPLYIWQQMVRDLAKNAEPRKVIVVVDKVGSHGKTTLKMNQLCKGEALVVPTMLRDANDMVEFLFHFVKDPSKKYTIYMDIPRATNGENSWAKWLSVVETVSDGMLYEHRYQPRLMTFEPPTVVMFTNNCPPLHLLSRDRWVINYLSGGSLIRKELEEFENKVAA